MEQNIPTHVCRRKQPQLIPIITSFFFSIKPIHGIRHIPKQALDMYNYVTPKQLLREFDYRSNQSTIFVNTYMNFFSHLSRAQLFVIKNLKRFKRQRFHLQSLYIHTYIISKNRHMDFWNLSLQYTIFIVKEHVFFDF